MEKGTKIALVTGGILLAAGIGYAVYSATKGASDMGDGGFSNTPPPPPPPGGGFNIQQVKDLFGNLVAATQEKFPLRIGMVGPKVRALQEALKTKFDKTSVATDGIFGVKTWNALKDLGYVTLALNTLSEADYNKVLAGESRTVTADGSYAMRRVGGADLGGYVGL